MNLKSLLYFSAIFVILSCSPKSSGPILSQEERIAIDSLGIYSTLVLDIKQVAKVNFNKMAGAVEVLRATNKGETLYPRHGIQVGYFDVPMNFNETTLGPIRESGTVRATSSIRLKNLALTG